MADDAVVLQTLVEVLLPAVKDKQPSKNAFFSRSHGFKPPKLEFDQAGDYLWFVRWREFAKKRIEIASAFYGVAVTDIANYFDSIDLRQLRNILTSQVSVDEVVVDLLFMILDAFIWRPDYLSPPPVGLPQVNFDAPRLLSHLYLFEIDRFLKEETGDNFLRWVDDITIAIDSAEQGKKLLGALDEMMASRGLRLNTGKTVVLSAVAARQYFWANENTYIDDMTNRVEHLKQEGKDTKAEKREVRKRFAAFHKGNRDGQWDKVYKRYVGLFGDLMDDHIQDIVGGDLRAMPALRSQIFRYYVRLGPSEQRLEHLASYLLSDDVLDDASVFGACKALTEWRIASASPLIVKIVEIAGQLSTPLRIATSPFFFVGALWLLVKYGRMHDIENLIWKNRNIWQQSPFLARQVASATPRLNPRTGLIAAIKSDIQRYGHHDAMSVIRNLDDMRSQKALRADEFSYLCYDGQTGMPYPLPKALMALAALSSPEMESKNKEKLLAKLTDVCDDELYRQFFNAAV